MQLSKHFVENWQRRVGSWPTEALIDQIIAQSVPVQPSRNLREHDGGHFRMLSIYWHPELDLVLKIDDYRGMAVTVLSHSNYTDRQTSNGRHVVQGGG